MYLEALKLRDLLIVSKKNGLARNVCIKRGGGEERSLLWNLLARSLLSRERARERVVEVFRGFRSSRLIEPSI